MLFRDSRHNSPHKTVHSYYEAISGATFKLKSLGYYFCRFKRHCKHKACFFSDICYKYMNMNIIIFLGSVFLPTAGN